jgi:rhodanese-related sulfurtransferase/DNA-binding transcriptional ArsR family regulator
MGGGLSWIKICMGRNLKKAFQNFWSNRDWCFMDDKEFKVAVYEGLSKLLKAISNPNRLEVIEILSQGEKSVEGIVLATGMTFANASQHLQVLKNNNIVKTRKDGHYVYYSLVGDEFIALHQHIVRYAATEIAELEKVVKRQREAYESQNPVTYEELERMIMEQNILLLDVRPTEEFDSGHIKGAISIPLDELRTSLKEYCINTEIVAYCRGPFCMLADEAVKRISELGYKVHRLDGSYPEWKIRQKQLN